jgi:hypothetical protein
MPRTATAAKGSSSPSRCGAAGTATGNSSATNRYATTVTTMMIATKGSTTCSPAITIARLSDQRHSGSGRPLRRGRGARGEPGPAPSRSAPVRSAFGIGGCTRWHAAKCPEAVGRSSGVTVRQTSMTEGQRVWKGHPAGGLAGLGTSPLRMIRSRRTVGSLLGIAERSAWL